MIVQIPSPGKSQAPMARPLVIRNLEHARGWLDKKLDKPSKFGEPWHAKNILVGCLELMDQCGRRTLRHWLDRRTGRRKALKEVRDRYHTKAGHRALSDLIDLTISDLGACTWRPDFFIDPLPIKVKPQSPRTESHKQKLKESAAQTRRRRKMALEARFP